MAKISNEVFVKGWYASHKAGESVSEFAKKVGYGSPTGASLRAKALRAKGVNLPELVVKGGPGFKGSTNQHTKKTAIHKPQKQPKPQANIVTAEDFVRIWQTADSIHDVVKKTNQTIESVRGRAAKFRKKGVPLKSLAMGNQGRPNDYAALAELAKSLVPAEASAPAQP